MSGRGTDELPANVDFALLHRVRRICLSDDKTKLHHEDPDHVMRKLCKNKLYGKRPKDQLRKSIEIAIGLVKKEFGESFAEKNSSDLGQASPVRRADKRPRTEDLPDTMSDGMRAKLRKRAAKNREDKKQEDRKLRKKEKSSPSSKYSRAMERPAVRFSDVGGVETCLGDVRELCEFPLVHPEVYDHLGVEPPRGILLHGPPGCGKTLLAHAIAGELGVPFFKVAAPEIISGMSGESEEKLRGLFRAAKRAAPSIIFIDEIDSIAPKRESTNRGMERRIVAQLIACMDSLSDYGEKRKPESASAPDAAETDVKSDANAGPPTDSKSVIVIGATSTPDSLDSSLRRAGRFDREICMGIPDVAAREHIFRVLVKQMRVPAGFDFRSIAVRTPGYVGADLGALVKEAAAAAVTRALDVRRIALDGDDDMEAESENAGLPPLNASTEKFSPEELASLSVEMADFELALTKVQPSSKREGFATVPSVTWNDIGALEEVRSELTVAITEPVKCPEIFERMGLSVPAGVLLFGPPGCGKTMVAKAVANGSGANFISIKGPELLNKFVGESERAVRQVFARARASAPCVIFFDELDALCPKRGGSGDSSSGVSERVVNQLLTEMDGLESRRNVFVIAATNRPDIIDPAMLRPGRLDKLLYVPLPSPEDRVAILKTCARKTPIDSSINLDDVGRNESLTGFSGADIAALVREACMCTLKRTNFGRQGAGAASPLIVSREDILAAMTRVSPSVSKKDERLYNAMRRKLRHSRSTLSSSPPPPNVHNQGVAK